MQKKFWNIIDARGEGQDISFSLLTGAEKIRDTKFKNKSKPYLPIPVKVMLSSSEAYWLYDTANNIGNGNYAHVGVACGGSIWCQLFALKSSTIYAVDLWDGVWCNELDMDKVAAFSAQVKICQGLTSDWAKKLSHVVFDFIFIDASHDYISCKEDWENWSPLTKPGSIIAFHDCQGSMVTQVVNEIDRSLWQEIEGMWTIRAFQRKG